MQLAQSVNLGHNPLPSLRTKGEAATATETCRIDRPAKMGCSGIKMFGVPHDPPVTPHGCAWFQLKNQTWFLLYHIALNLSQEVLLSPTGTQCQISPQLSMLSLPCLKSCKHSQGLPGDKCLGARARPQGCMESDTGFLPTSLNVDGTS